MSILLLGSTARRKGDNRSPIGALLGEIAKSGQRSFVAVLKTCGDLPSPGLLSFPAEGPTLSLDFPNRGRQRTMLLFDCLDVVVREARGQLYAAKDGRIPKEMWTLGYPNLERFINSVDRGFFIGLLEESRGMTDNERSRLIILGALSAIAEAAARQWAATRLSAGTRTISILWRQTSGYGLQVETHLAGLSSRTATDFFDHLVVRLGGVDIVLLAYGVRDQKRAESDPREARTILDTNMTSAAAWCLAAANVLEKQDHGSLIVIGSVAGDRGRASKTFTAPQKGASALWCKELPTSCSIRCERSIDQAGVVRHSTDCLQSWMNF